MKIVLKVGAFGFRALVDENSPLIKEDSGSDQEITLILTMTLGIKLYEPETQFIFRPNRIGDKKVGDRKKISPRPFERKDGWFLGRAAVSAK